MKSNYTNSFQRDGVATSSLVMQKHFKDDDDYRYDNVVAAMLEYASIENRDLKEMLSEIIRIGELEDLTFTDEAATKLFQFWINRAKNILQSASTLPLEGGEDEANADLIHEIRENMICGMSDEEISKPYTIIKK